MSEKKEILILTKNAIKHIARLSKEMGKDGHGLKIEIIPGGCSGYKYFMDFVEEPEEDDIVHELDDVKVFIHKDSVDMLEGSELDYIESLQGAGFTFNNPNAAGCCGCGKSFC